MSFKEETLDPENWDELRALGHRMLDETLDSLENIRSFQNSFPSENDVKNIQVELSDEGEGEEKVYKIFRKHILPSTLVTPQPRMWAYVAGSGSPYGMLTEMLASGTNMGVENMGVASYFTHKQAIEWIKELLEYPKDAGGVLVSGGSEANFTGIAVARNAKAKKDMKSLGVHGQSERMTLYGSEEMHHCLERSVEILGLGNEAIRLIPVDEEYRVKTDVLKKTITEDRSSGMHPFCIVGNAGTVNTGAFDDFKELRLIADQEDMWFHVDGAFGAWLKLSESHKHLVDGIESADSLAVDLHKWMDMPYGVGCTLVRDRVAHYSTFVYGHEAEYLKTGLDRTSDALSDPHMLALPLSRCFSSLKVYMLLRAFGRNKYRRLVQQNLDQMLYLAGLIEGSPVLELASTVSSNVVCFRYVKDGLSNDEVDELNKSIRGRIMMSDFAIISDTVLSGRFVLRACNVNHRSRREDFDYLVDKVTQIGAELAS